jgi:quercetin dioxygenase-like cupin family protein
MKKLFFVLYLAGLSACATANNSLKTIEVTPLAKSSLSWDGQKLPAYPAGTPEVTILKIRIPPKAQLALHKHNVINAGVVLAGELTVITEKNETLHLKAGDSLVEVVNKWHYGKNEGNKVTELIVFYAGVIGEPITVTAEKGQE